ncbi:hypothetical protein C7212DRAFT_350422 [Tuber magnatum]|uniref:Transmembrane protein n=1 Tax=Tuber magnatum TaxID=42249 RepID=A0A317SZ18_9PEZI|nr:hypothetical protein C7212DRAFT_350422 [Tuber magnatum]
MPISKKLRLEYVAEWLLVVSASALPMEQSPVVEGAAGSMAVMLGLNPSEGAGSQHVRVEGRQGTSTVANNLLVAGGAAAAFIFVAAIAFWLYKTRGRTFRRANFRRWNRGAEYRRRGGDTTYDEKSSVYPQSTIFGGGSSTQPVMERKHSVPGVPFPPPAALAPSDTSLGRHQSRKHLLSRTSHLLPEKRPVSSPSPVDEKGTFYDGDSDVDSFSSSPQQEEPPLPPPPLPILFHFKRQTPKTTPTSTNTYNRQQPYTQTYPPPPIPESETSQRNAPQMVSRFSWTTTATLEAPSGAKSVRSSLDSEPRFRGVNSWVSHQAGRLGRKERLAQLQLEQQQEEEQAWDIPLGSPPETPSAFRHHPGAPVSFLEHRARMEAAAMDGRLSRGGR